jgi:putative sigma-54 modulation protein
MNINLTGHHIDITPALREYVTTKMEKIQRYFHNITNIHIILGVDKLIQKAEAHVNMARLDIFAQAESEDMYAAIDMMMDKLERQVVKHKEKLNSHGNAEDNI